MNKKNKLHVVVGLGVVVVGGTDVEISPHAITSTLSTFTGSLESSGTNVMVTFLPSLLTGIGWDGDRLVKVS